MFGSDITPHQTEIVFCDFNRFQIAIPSYCIRQRSHENTGLEHIRPKRIYRDYGWISYHGHLFGQLEGLRLTPHQTSTNPFPVTPRIAVGMPLCFEIHCDQPLPPAIAEAACFCYQLLPFTARHYAYFRNLIPQFVRIYPLVSTADLTSHLQQFLQAAQIHRPAADLTR